MRKHQCVMIVDNDPITQSLLEHTLELEGYGITTATDGGSALALLEEHMPDIILMDTILPDRSALQVLSVIRQHCNVPVIMLTKKYEVTGLQYALALGADDYVRKSFHTGELVARIRAKLRRAGTEVTMPIRGG